MRVRAKHLLFAHYMIESWASWQHTHAGENGVMGSLVSAYSPDRGSTPPKSLVPNLDMPRDVSQVDREYLDAPENHRKIIQSKYLDMEKVSRYAEERMLEFMAGRLMKST